MSVLREYKEHEFFSNLRIPPTIPFVIRCDGRNFHRLCTELRLERPYDERLIKVLVRAGMEIYEAGFNPLLIYVFSDELNIVFTSDTSFSRRYEKLVSILPSIVSARTSVELSKLFGRDVIAAFDARVVLLSDFNDIVNYLIWRQSDCWRNFLNSYAQTILLKRGFTPREISKELSGKGSEYLLNLICSEFGSVDAIPTWQRRGVLIFKKKVTKISRNPLTGTEVEVTRRVTYVEWNVPLFSSTEGRRLVEQIYAEYCNGRERS
ncbi:MAG: hypothetical protein DRJ40_10145 [Thermoprotei archaeon]|nr:MAG: hypothetical protein DRJ40_10145 [Thermoprotei archaeon]